MGARGYAKPAGGRKAKEPPYSPAKCVIHPRRNAEVWASFGKAPGMSMCDECHGRLIAKWIDAAWVKSLHGDRLAAERAVLDTLRQEVA